MSINRTRWLDKLRPAGASSGGWTGARWHLLRPLMQLLLTSAAHSNIGQGGDTIIQTPKLCVALRMGQANLLSISNCHPCAGAMLSSHSILQATRFVRVILEPESISSSQGEEKKKTNLCVLSLCKPYLCIVQKKTSQILTVILVQGHEAISRVAAFRRRNSVILAQGPCNSVQSHTIFVQSRAAVSRRRNSVILAQGPCNIVQRKRKASSSIRGSYLPTSIGGFHRFAPREHHGRSFRKKTWR